MVCEHIGVVISPLVMHRLQNLQKGILKYSFRLKKYEEVILKERDKMVSKSWIAGTRHDVELSVLEKNLTASIPLL